MTYPCQDRSMNTQLLDIQAMIPSWVRALRSERKSPHTVKADRQGILVFLGWCEKTGTTPELTKGTVQTFVADRLNSGTAAKTVGNDLLALRRFADWLGSEDEIDTNPLAGMQQPKLDRKVVE